MVRRKRRPVAPSPLVSLEPLELRRLLDGEPLAVNDLFVVSEDSVLQIAAPGVLLNDVGGGPLTATVATLPQHGALELLADGTFHYQPDPDFFGEDSFSYQALDGQLASTPATVKLTVLPVADGPATPQADVYFARQDTPLLATGLERSLAEAGFNDEHGIGAAPETNVPYSLGAAIAGQGTGELGWAGPWVQNEGAVAKVSADSLEGDGALLILPTGLTARQWQVADPSAPFTFEMRMQFSPNSYISLYLFDGAGGLTNFNADAVGGPQLNIDEQGNLAVVDGGDSEPSGFQVEPGQWHTMTFRIDPATQSYRFFFDNVEAPGPDPFNFRGAPAKVDSIAFVPQVSGTGILVDAIQIYVGHETPGVLANERNVDAAPLTAQLEAAPAHAAAFTLNADGTFAYTPTTGFLGQDSFTYRLNDGAELSLPTLVTILVQDVRHAPIAVDDAYHLDQDSPLAVLLAVDGVLKNDTDADGDALTAEIATGPAHGQLEFHADGTFTYAPAPGFHGADLFTYRTSDQRFGSNTATVHLLVAPQPTPPVAQDDAYVVPAGGVLDLIRQLTVKNISTGWNDALGARLPYGVPDLDYVIAPGGTGGLSGSPPNVMWGEEPFSWVHDRTSRNSRWLTIVKEPPQDVFVPPGTYFFETQVDLTGYDPTTAALAGFRFAVDNSLESIEINGQSVAAPGGGLGQFQSLGTLGQGAFIAGMNTIRFVVRNDPSGNNPLGLRVEGRVEAEALAGPAAAPGVLANDASPTRGPAAPSLGAVLGSANPWLAGMADGSAASGSDRAPQQSPFQVVEVAVQPGETLIISGRGGVSSADGTVSLPDGTLEFVQHGSAENGLANLFAPQDSLIGLFLANPSPNSSPAPNALDFRSGPGRVPNGINYVQLSPLLKQPFFVGDGLRANGAPQQIVVPNGAKRLFLGVMDSGANANNLGSFQVEVANPLVIESKAVVVSGPQHGDLELLADGRFRYSPNAGYVGPDSFQYRIASRFGDSNPATVSLSVQPSLPPTVANDEYTVGQSLPLRVGVPQLVKDLGTGINDRDGTKLPGLAADEDYRIGPGSAEGYEGMLTTVVPGEKPFGYLAADSASPSSRWIGVGSATNENFNAFPSQFSFETTFDLTGYDPRTAFIDGFRWAADNFLSGAIINGRLAYASSAVSPGPLTAPVSIGQGMFQAGANTIRFVVDNQESGGYNLMALRVEGRVLAFPSGQQTLPGLLANDHDPLSHPLVAELVAPPAHGSLELEADGRFIYVPTPDFAGVDEFTYRAVDGLRASDPATVKVTVVAANNNPQASDDQYPLPVNGELTAGQRVVVKDISTGYDDDAGEKLPFLAADNDYRMADGEFDGQTPTVMQSPYPDPYLPDAGSAKSRWILIRPDVLPGQYVFETTVDLTGYDPSTAWLAEVRFSADDVLGEIRINGANVLPAAGGGIDLWHHFHALGQGKFKAGVNVIQFVVTNGDGGYNAMALRVEGQVEAFPAPAAPSLLANDRGPRGLPLLASLETGPAHGVLSLNADGSFRYVPNPGFQGYDKFAYRASDDAGDSGITQVFLRVGVPPLPGDANGDGSVDLTDFGLLKANFGAGTSRPQGDFNEDQMIDLTDFGILKENFGLSGQLAATGKRILSDAAWQAAIDGAIQASDDEA